MASRTGTGSRPRLDRNSGTRWLSDERIARLVEDAFLHFDGSRYHLHSWVVMPNHVHVLITPLHENSLSSILHSWKSFTGKKASAILGLKGAFWARDCIDRMVRDERHYNAVVEYIHNNPVKAALSQRPEEWRWSSAWERRH